MKTHSAGAVLAAHRDRLRGIDPLLPETGPLPEAGPSDTPLAAPSAVGVERRVVIGPDDLQATWGALDQRWLLARVGSPAAMAALLARWREHLAGAETGTETGAEAHAKAGAEAGAEAGADSAAIVVWPSRDVVMTPVFVAHGLIPDHVIAVRPAGRPDGTTPAAVRVRRAGAADLDAVVGLRLEEARFGAQLSGLPARPGTAALMRDRYAAVLAAAEPWVWLAETEGAAVGLVSVTVGDQAAWIAPLVAAAPVAYVDCAAVAPTYRGGGIAAALIHHAHRALDDAGIAATLLHYSALNPLSAPFWHRSGYRPLHTRWQLTPAR
jgi:GNAT superfamily N-acetyltransferase